MFPFCCFMAPFFQKKKNKLGVSASYSSYCYCVPRRVTTWRAFWDDFLRTRAADPPRILRGGRGACNTASPNERASALVRMGERKVSDENRCMCLIGIGMSDERTVMEASGERNILNARKTQIRVHNDVWHLVCLGHICTSFSGTTEQIQGTSNGVSGYQCEIRLGKFTFFEKTLMMSEGSLGHPDSSVYFTGPWDSSVQISLIIAWCPN